MKKPNKSKDELRKPLLQLRSQLSESEQQNKSALIIEHIKQSDIFAQSSKIAFYHAVRGEADPAGLYNIESNKQFFLPILSADKDQGLIFAPIDQNTQYKNNAFAIPEPIVDSHKLINAEELDLVVMPLLGFDILGNRLGMGGGYYDRSFAFKKSNPSKPILIGFAYDFQKIDPLNTEPWDVGLDWIATESGIKKM